MQELESNEDKTPLDGLNPERVPVGSKEHDALPFICGNRTCKVFPFLRLALDIIHRLEAARPGDAELVQHVSGSWCDVLTGAPCDLRCRDVRLVLLEEQVRPREAATLRG